jgi:hypothetical protein
VVVLSLSFPKSLSQRKLAAAKRKLDGLPNGLAQQVIDELAVTCRRKRFTAHGWPISEGSSTERRLVNSFRS